MASSLKLTEALPALKDLKGKVREACIQVKENLVSYSALSEELRNNRNVVMWMLYTSPWDNVVTYLLYNSIPLEQVSVVYSSLLATDLGKGLPVVQTHILKMSGQEKRWQEEKSREEAAKKAQQEREEAQRKERNDNDDKYQSIRSLRKLLTMLEPYQIVLVIEMYAEKRSKKEVEELTCLFHDTIDRKMMSSMPPPFGPFARFR